MEKFLGLKVHLINQIYHNFQINKLRRLTIVAQFAQEIKKIEKYLPGLLFSSIRQSLTKLLRKIAQISWVSLYSVNFTCSSFC